MFFNQGPRNEFVAFFSKLPFYVNTEYSLKNGVLQRAPNILELMLHEREEERLNIFQICLLTNLNQCITNKLTSPLSKRFKPKVISKDFNINKIYYCDKPLCYEGQSLERHHLVKNGNGILSKVRTRQEVSSEGKRGYKRGG